MKKLVLSIATVALLASCGGKEKMEVKTNETNKAVTPNTTVSASSASGIYNVVKDSTNTLTWTGSAIGKSHYGTVDYAGALTIKAGKLVGGELNFDMKTINSQDLEGEWKQKLDGHLMAPDFFNVDSFPTAKLSIKGFDGTNINGELTIKNVAKEIVIPATVNITDNKVEGSAEFSINRTEYGIVYGSGNFFELAKDKVISDEISFKVSINAIK